MQLNNPFQMNDWEIRKFIKVILVIQFVLWGAIGLDAIGLQIPIVRPLIGFIYLTFVPGILILRILKLHKLGNIETLLYTVGLSLATLMFTGFFMNFVYPFFGISGPISLISLIITISVVVLVLCLLCYVRDKDFTDPSFVDVGEVLSLPVLFLCLIPFMAVLGTHLVNFYHNNLLLMLMIIVIALVALLIGFDKFIPVKLYPLAIWVIAISLVWHDTLISTYLNIFDVFSEYNAANSIIINQIWAYSIPNNTNAMLSIVMLAPIFHNILNMDLTWIFKVIYPLVFSLVPLGVYDIFQKRTTDKIAFFSCFLLISTCTFYTVISSTTKQSTAEFFVVLLVILILTKNMDKMKRSGLLMIFAISLIISHYGTTYLILVSLIFVLLFLYLKEGIADKSGVGRESVSLTFVLFFIIFTLTWYIYISSSSTFNAIISLGNHIANTLFMNLFRPEYSRGIYILTKEMQSPLHEIGRFLHVIVQFFIGLGILKLLLKRGEMKFEGEYIVFSLYWFAICVAAIAVGSFAVMNPVRLYHLALLLLSPLAIMGGIFIFEVIIKIFKMSWTNKSVKISLRVLSVFLVIFLLFNTGFIFEIVKDHPTSISISQESIKNYGDIEDRGIFYAVIIPTYDVFSSRWLSKNMDHNKKIYATIGWGQGAAVLVTYGSIDESKIYHIDNKITSITNSYIYLHYFNVVEKIRLDNDPHGKHLIYSDITDIYPLIKDKNKIYDNGGSQILLAQ